MLELVEPRPSFAPIVLFWRCQPAYKLLLGAKQRILLIKERFRLAENLRSTRSARCSPSVFFLKCSLLAICISKVLTAREKNLTTARARKN